MRLVAAGQGGESAPLSKLQQAESVLAFLNQKTGRKFPAQTPSGQPTAATLLIWERLRDGYSVEDLRSVIALKWRMCRSDKDRFFMRPATLFRKSNFEQSVGELE